MIGLPLALRRFLRRLWASLRSGWSLALLSFVLAAALWVFVTDAENPPRTDLLPSRIPVEPVNVPEGLAIAGGTAIGSVAIRVTAREDVWDELTAASFAAKVDLTDAQQGTIEVPVRVDVAEDLADEVTVLDITPQTVDVRLDLLVSQTVPVRVNITGQPPIGFDAGEERVEPTQAAVSGPEALVRQVSQVEADVNLTGATVSLSRSFRLVPRSASGQTIDGVRVTPDTAVVSIDVTQTVYSRPLVVRPSIAGRVADGYQVQEVTAEPLVVVAFGTLEALQSLSFVATEDVDVTGATSDVTRSVLLRLPPDVSAPGQPMVNVQVRIAPAQGEAEYGIAPRVIDLASGLSVALSTPTITIRVTGDLPVLRQLRLRDIVVTIDASDLGPGVYSFRPQIQLPEGVRLVDYSPAEVTVTVSTR